MADETIPQTLEIDLGDHGNRLTFQTPAELRSWIQREYEAWSWIISAGSHQLGFLQQNFQQIQNQLGGQANEWDQRLRNNQSPDENFKAIRNVILNCFNSHQLLSSTSPEGKFVISLRDARGQHVAAGAFAALLGRTIESGRIEPEFIHGLFEGFLYRREIDWTATAHREGLNELRKQYETGIHNQDKRSAEIEQRNARLNESYEVLLKQRSDELTQFQSDNTASLNKLRDEQVEEFQKTRAEHEKKLEAIEETYDRKLALQKPVKYWKVKKAYHGRRTKHFFLGAVLTAIFACGGLACLAFITFHSVKPGESPEHWRVAVLVVSAFFAIWGLRLVVRVLLSHLHLATDAAERETMVLTYLALSREGTDTSPEDKKLILEHLFRTTSDGLVKDDGAPPSMFEMFTRK